MLPNRNCRTKIEFTPFLGRQVARPSYIDITIYIHKQNIKLDSDEEKNIANCCYELRISY